MGAKRIPALVLLLAVLLTGTAHADGVQNGADIQVAQTLGERELTVVIRRVDTPPAPLRVDIVTHQGTPPGTLTVKAAVEGAVFSETTVALDAKPGYHGGTLRVDRAGPWELQVGDGKQLAKIPFVVPAKITPAWELAAYGGFVVAGFLLFVALVMAVRGRSGMVPAAGMLVALTVAVTSALLSSTIPPPPAPGTKFDPTFGPDPQVSSVDYSRPPVNLVVDRQERDLRLRFSDGSTGRPADDLLVHDNALVHFVVVSPSGRLWHLHPIRVAPGEYRAHLKAPEAGSYAVSAEIARRGGGVQLLRSAITLPQDNTDPAPPVAEASLRQVISPAGTPSTITARFPKKDLQPWLGMLGHMIVAGPIDGDLAKAPVWAHVHAMTPATPGLPDRPDETVAAFGPDVPFTYTFPLPGKYFVWIQAERGYSVLTVPAVIDVPPTRGPQG
ncbi:hypothetical protein SAMN05421504_11723 [Amycolatopsis xylanica]|uniref:Secreted protein n=1 Tax=Amycolatopsis xylanica TaxID=589385 RepID=A0A1H3T2Z4_9PSEU|nr:hypothetical protein [Amycolatopsis xylanica]SDZ44238.1 hypothetical protein SAMN05421504_11723 [Amycolatopsis xylanica]